MSETQHLRNDRACKGRRYQEFKDQALGRKGSRNNSLNSRPGDRSSVDGMILTNLKNENSSQRTKYCHYIQILMHFNHFILQFKETDHLQIIVQI